MGNLGIGLNFTLIGMSVVFLFLIVMVGAVNVMRVVVDFWDRRSPAVSAAGDGEEEIAAVIAVACAKNKGV